MQSLFSWKNEKNISKCRLLKILPRVLGVMVCTNKSRMGLCMAKPTMSCTKRRISLHNLCLHISSLIRAFALGWSGGAKVLCILHHRGVQLILAYSWARPAILGVGKGRGGMFLFLLFLHFHSCSSFFPVPLFHLLYSLFYLFSPFLWETTQNDPQGLTCR